ncbi:unnamed protein product [Durusdinium trenchii]|uniref:Uncharacterized protein n=1 Tax=Durusdinium trenchii TaxID=1381693 RepID=A0ABP0K479_9DINO
MHRRVEVMAEEQNGAEGSFHSCDFHLGLLDSCDLSMGTDRMANEDGQDGNEYLESVLVDGRFSCKSKEWLCGCRSGSCEGPTRSLQRDELESLNFTGATVRMATFKKVMKAI